MSALLVYGATGFTGRRLVERARARGLVPVLAGRNGAALAALAEATGCPYRVAHLDDAGALDRMLDGMDVVVHAAGPFSRTAAPMREACVRTRTHYLDLTGENDVVEAHARRGDVARAAGVMVMPAVGYEVVPTDCLAAYVAARLPGACRLAIGIAGLRFMTPGSAKTFLGHARGGQRVRRNGVLVDRAPGESERTFPFEATPRAAVGVSLTDVASAYYTTGIPNIEGFYAATPAMRAVVTAWRYAGPLVGAAPTQAVLHAAADLYWRGPTREEQAEAGTVIVAEAVDGRGGFASARLHTPEPYAVTVVTATMIAERVLAGDFEPGFQTPARVYGSELVLAVPGVHREDLA